MIGHKKYFQGGGKWKSRNQGRDNMLMLSFTVLCYLPTALHKWELTVMHSMHAPALCHMKSANCFSTLGNQWRCCATDAGHRRGPRTRLFSQLLGLVLHETNIRTRFLCDPSIWTGVYFRRHAPAGASRSTREAGDCRLVVHKSQSRHSSLIRFINIPMPY